MTCSRSAYIIVLCYLYFKYVYILLLHGLPASTASCNLEVPGSNLSQAEYLSSWLCIYSAPNRSRHGVCNAAYGTVHYKEPLKSFEIRVGHTSSSFLLSRYCHDFANSDVKYILTVIKTYAALKKESQCPQHTSQADAVNTCHTCFIKNYGYTYFGITPSIMFSLFMGTQISKW